MGRNLFFDKEVLIRNLKIARMDIYYKDFVKNSAKLAMMMAVGLNIIIFFILASVARNTGSYIVLLLMLITIPMGFYILFMFFLKTPEVKIIRSRKNIDAEITSAIRFLVLDLKANAPIFDAFQNLVKNFDEIGKYLRDVVIKVKLGSSLEESLNEAVELVPSESFRIMLWQIINHLQTGTDISHTLGIIVKEIVENQKIEFKKYGKKLNVLSLFYMIVAIILPTIGFAMISAALIFIGVTMNVGIILGFWILFSTMQLMFLAMSGGNRPVVES
ncbi:type II secretion system F family protein [Candidatus Woesearchaeota archaeon]|nr:type II secretion system F family protein [Candidatus Woesearchaeota archaeon]